MGLDGTVVEDLGLPADAWMANLSPDGSKVAFLTTSVQVGFCGGCSTGSPPSDRLAVVRVGKAHGAFVYRSRGPSLSSIEEPVWSPTGQQIAFAATRKGNVDIYVADVGSHPHAALIIAPFRRLTSSPAVDEFPAWSENGDSIFYDNSGRRPLDDSGFSHTQEIWRVPAAGGTPRRLTHNEAVDVQPDVSSDGTVAFWRDGQIWTMDADGTRQQPLNVVPENTGFNPRWSPDGRMMALLRYDPSERAAPIEPVRLRDDDAPLLRVVVVDLRTGHVRTVGPRVATDFNPVAWMPDGTALLVDRYDDGGT